MSRPFSADATEVDAYVMAHLVAAAKHPSLSRIRAAFEVGVPLRGSVSKRSVQAASTIAARCGCEPTMVPNSGSAPAGKRVIDLIPNPFQAPHNLSWYLHAADVPDEVRSFAAKLSKGHIRVWSVAKDQVGWHVLAQVFGADSAKEARDVLTRDAARPSKSLRKHVMADVTSVKAPDMALPTFVANKVLPASASASHYVNVTLTP